jgi:hypothetical protein
MSGPAPTRTHLDLLRTAAVIATNHGIDQQTFVAAAEAAYADLVHQGYTPNRGPLPPAPIPLQTGMTKRQQNILQFYAATEAKRGHPPTIREAQEGLNLSSTAVVIYNLKVLVERHLMQHTPGAWRGYRTRWS